MIYNSKVTIYHSSIDENGNTKWKRFNYNYAWIHGGKGAGTNKGYDNANDVDVRIWYKLNKNLDIHNISIGDIIVLGESLQDIQIQQDLQGYEFYNVTSITNNTFGNNQHIHLGGK